MSNIVGTSNDLMSLYISVVNAECLAKFTRYLLCC